MTKNRKSTLRFLIAALAIGIGIALLTARSFYFSDSITIFDLTITTDEGLVAMTLPMVRHAQDLPYSNEWFTFFRDKNHWKSDGGGGKMPLRNLLELLESPNKAMSSRTATCQRFFDFGYWITQWQRPERPGPAITLFTPTWSLGLLGFVLFALLEFRYVRFTIRSLLVLTALVAVIFWIISLESPSPA